MRYFTDNRGRVTGADHGLGTHIPSGPGAARLPPQPAFQAPRQQSPFRLFSPAPQRGVGIVATANVMDATAEFVEAGEVVVPGCPVGWRARKVGGVWKCCIWNTKDGVYDCVSPSSLIESTKTDLQRSLDSCKSKGGVSSTMTNKDGTKTLTCTGYDKADPFKSKSVWFDANGKFIDSFI